MIRVLQKQMVFGFILIFISLACVHSQPGKNGFQPQFTILYASDNPDLAMRPAGIPNISYNVATWKTYPGKQSDLPITKKDVATAGDGFDDSILKSKSSGRTVSQYNAAQVIPVVGKRKEQRGDTVFF